MALVAPKVPGEVTPKVAAVEPSQIPAPGVLTEGERQYWDLWAPVAVARGMLHPGTVPGFVLLCQTAYRADEFWRCIQSRGYEQQKVTVDGAGQEHVEHKANSLITHWRALLARTEQLQARYGIAADGKVPMSEDAGDAEDRELASLLAVK